MLIINYGIIMKSISTLICTVWHVDKYKITIKLVINSRRISRGPYWCEGPVRGRGPAVEKHYIKAYCLVAFVKLRKTTVIFVTSVRLSARNNLASTARIFMVFPA